MKLREVLDALIFRFRHPNLMTLMAYFSAPPPLVYPFMVRMSLFVNLHKFKVNAISLPRICTYFGFVESIWSKVFRTENSWLIISKMLLNVNGLHCSHGYRFSEPSAILAT